MVRQFSEGLHDLGSGVYAYLQPDGGWGLGNAGLIADQGEALLVDTLMDLPRTRAMLAAMREAEPAATEIGTVVNTSADGDHTHGNQLLSEARIIASRGCLEDMIVSGSPSEQDSLAKSWRKFGTVGAFFQRAMWSRFDSDNIVHTPPTDTFSGEMELTVGAKTVRLVEVGPAHTRGDVLVHVPSDRIVYAGDIVSIGSHPIAWTGPIRNWIKACDLILGWDVETIVPGHGPITDKDGIRGMRDYLQYIHHEFRKRFEAGMDAERAARDIPLDRYADWLDPERVIVNVMTCYHEFQGGIEPQWMDQLYAMAGLYFERNPEAAADPADAVTG